MSLNDNKIDKTIKNLSIVFLVVFLLSTIFVSIVLVGNMLYGLNATQPPEILLALLWTFFIIFYLIYITLFTINYPSRPEGIKKRKERNPIAEKLLIVTGMILFWVFLGMSVFIVLMIVGSLILELPSMLSLEVILVNLGCIIAIFFIQLITIWLMNNSIKKIEQKKEEAFKHREWKKKMALKEHIPKTVKEAKDYLIHSYKAGNYQAKLDKEAFRKQLGKLNDEQLIKDFFAVKEEQTLIKLDLYAK